MESVSFCFWALSFEIIKFQPLILHRHYLVQVKLCVRAFEGYTQGYHVNSIGLGHGIGSTIQF